VAILDDIFMAFILLMFIQYWYTDTSTFSETSTIPSDWLVQTRTLPLLVSVNSLQDKIQIQYDPTHLQC